MTPPKRKTSARAPAPMLTDRQAALFAATNMVNGKAQLDDLLSLADRCARWLAGEEHVALAAAGDNNAPPASRQIIEAALDRLRKSLAAAFPGDAKAQQAWALEWTRGLKIHRIEEATLADVRAAIVDLNKRKARA